MDLSIFASHESWMTLATLLFLELALGVDNLVFISITCERLPKDKQHLGRRLGLAGALAARIVLLLFASALVHMTAPLFTLSVGPLSHGFSVRDVVLLVGGGYLVYKGVSEICRTGSDAGGAQAPGAPPHKGMGLAQAVVTIAAMDVVFSIDSVITAVGLADQLAIIVIAVIAAILLMMLLVDQISRFVTENPGIEVARPRVHDSHWRPARRREHRPGDEASRSAASTSRRRSSTSALRLPWLSSSPRFAPAGKAG